PENLHLAPAGETPDERLRLFYVAATRARKTLTVNYSDKSDNGKSLDIASFLVNDLWKPDAINIHSDLQAAVMQAEIAWYDHIIAPKQELNDALANQIEDFKLSTTALGNFIDVTRGGPQYFLLQNLLHFPQAPSPNAAYGTAIHRTLQQAHSHLTATEN